MLLLAGDLLMPKMRLREPVITNSGSGLFTKTKEIKNFKEKGGLKYIY